MGLEGLDFQTVDVKFTQGMDTRTQRKLVVPGKWDELFNLTLSDDNTPQTRPGHATLISTARGNGLATYNEQLLTISGPVVTSVSLATNSATTVAGLIGNVRVSKAEVRRSTGMQDTPDCATTGTVTCYVWREKTAANVVTGIGMTLVDEFTGTQLLSNQTLRTSATVSCPRVVCANDGTLFIFYVDGNDLFCRVLSGTTLGAEVSLVNSLAFTPINIDACAFGASDGSVMVIYGWNDGLTSVRTIEVTQTALVPSIGAGPVNLFAEIDIPAATITALCCAAFDSGAKAGGFVTSTGAAAQCGLAGVVISTVFAVTAGPLQLNPTVGATTSDCHLTAVVDSTRLRVFRDFYSQYDNTSAITNIVGQVVSDALATFTGPTNIQPSASFTTGAGSAKGTQGPFIHGKAFGSGGRIYLPVFVANTVGGFGTATSNPRTFNAQNTFMVLDTGAEGASLSAGVVVCRALSGSYGPGSVAGSRPTCCTPCSSPRISGGVYATVAGELADAAFDDNSNNISPTGLVRLTLEPNFSLPPIREQLGESTFVAGGSLATFDGLVIAEHGFPLFPDGVYLSLLVGVGICTPGVHQVCVVYEWVDNSGQRCQSAPSSAVTITAGVTDAIVAAVPTLLMSQKPGVRLVAYMTTAGGTIFYRSNRNAATYAPFFNSTTANTINISINSTDASLAGNEALYTQPNQAGTVLPNIAPPPINALAVAQNRLWFDVADQPGAFGYSQEYVNNIGLEFNPGLAGRVPVDGGNIVAVASLDEKVVFFCRRRIYVVYGTGPTPSGGFNNYSPPQDIGSDVGCSDARSVLSTFPGGIIFKSQKGWYLLGRGLEVKYIGDAVARWDGQQVTAAVLLENSHECRFTTDGGEGPVTLVYSYLVDQWSYFQYAEAEYSPVDAIWWPSASNGSGNYVTIALSQGLNQDTPNLVDSPGGISSVGIVTRGRTGWLHLSQMEGYQRVRWLYLTSTSTLAPVSTFTIDVDFDDAYGGAAPGAYAFSVTMSQAFPTFTGQAIDLRHKLKRQKCKSVAFTFTETPAVGSLTQRTTGMQAMMLQIGLKRGTNKLKASQGVG